MVLLDAIVEIGTLSDADRLQLSPRSTLKPVCRITGQDSFPVRLAAVDDDPLGSAVPLKCLAQEPLRGSQIAAFAEPKLNCVAVAVDGTIKIPPLTTHLDVRFIYVP